MLPSGRDRQIRGACLVPVVVGTSRIARRSSAIGIREVLSRRRLIAYLVRADLKKTGADTLLGNVWWVVDPLLQMLIYSVLVALILDAPGRRTTRCSCFAAILPWKWFEATVKDGVSVDRRRRSG